MAARADSYLSGFRAAVAGFRRRLDGDALIAVTVS
jgi:hypothetical protein